MKTQGEKSKTQGEKSKTQEISSQNLKVPENVEQAYTNIFFKGHVLEKF